MIGHTQATESTAANSTFENVHATCLGAIMTSHSEILQPHSCHSVASLCCFCNLSPLLIALYCFTAEELSELPATVEIR